MLIKRPLIIAIFLLSLSIPSTRADDSIPIVNFEELEPLLHQSDDTLYVINFWATWCVPCRKELPYFEEVHRNFSDKKVKVILVSLDFVSRLESATIPFLQKNEITAPVILLNDPSSNAWIDKVSAEWSGALPATLFYLKDDRKFFEKEMNYNDIVDIIHTFTLNQ